MFVNGPPNGHKDGRIFCPKKHFIERAIQTIQSESSRLYDHRMTVSNLLKQPIQRTLNDASIFLQRFSGLRTSRNRAITIGV